MAYARLLSLALGACIVCCIFGCAGALKKNKTKRKHIRFPNGWESAANADEIYGWESFKARGLYKRGMAEPTICKNVYDYPRNKTTSDGHKMYEYMFCPTPDLNGTFSGCCGNSDRQKCCNIDGLATFVLVIIIVITILVCCCCCAIGGGIMFYMAKKRKANAPLYHPPVPPAPGYGAPPPAPGYGAPPPAYGEPAPVHPVYGGQHQHGLPLGGGKQQWQPI
ncbi:hypothetical protein LSAT2_008659 [Lamellibrachia satsuma]|nr:hypothetical protein LSAT2_008659 [Lamellibrachia satsuma]